MKTPLLPREGVYGLGYNNKIGGFAEIIVSGKKYPASFIIAAIATHKELTKRKPKKAKP